MSTDKERLESLKELMDQKFKCLEEAVGLARVEMNRRLAEMNEFRAQLTTQAADFLTKEVYDSKHQALQSQVNELREFKVSVNAKASQGQMYLTFVLALMGLFVAVISLITPLVKHN